MIIAGFQSGSLVHKSCYETRISIPSLHVSGKTDEIILQELSQLVEAGFEYPKKVYHEGGHYFPATVNEKQVYIEFFQDQLQKHLEDKEMHQNGVTVEDEAQEVEK